MMRLSPASSMRNSRNDQRFTDHSFWTVSAETPALVDVVATIIISIVLVFAIMVLVVAAVVRPVSVEVFALIIGVVFHAVIVRNIIRFYLGIGVLCFSDSACLRVGHRKRLILSKLLLRRDLVFGDVFRNREILQGIKVGRNTDVGPVVSL